MGCFRLAPWIAIILSVCGSLASAAAGQASLQQRIEEASPGDEIVVEGGVHRGDFAIDKPLTLVGIDRPLIQGSGAGHVVAIRAEGVSIRGFRIVGSGLSLSADHAAIHVSADGASVVDNEIAESLHGVYVRGVDGIRVANNRIEGIEETDAENLGATAVAAFGSGALCAVSRDRRGNGIHFWKSSDNLVTGNEISGVRDGIYFSFTRQSRVEANAVYDARYGLHYMYSDGNVLSRNAFFRNAAGATLMFSKEVALRDNAFVDNRGPRAYGLILHNVDRTTVENNRMTQNRVGYYMQNSHANAARGNELSRNQIGLRLTSSSTNNLFAGNRIGRNLHNIDLSGRDNQNRWSENGAGNRWLDAGTLDLDGDGISELTHREVDLFGPSREAFPFVAFLAGSPGMKVLQRALQRAPIPGAHYITDRRPLAAAPRRAGRHEERRDPRD